MALPYPYIKTYKEYPVVSPILAGRTVWHPIKDAGGNKDVTWLDLIAPDESFVFRIAHFYAHELGQQDRIFPEGIPERWESARGHLIYKGSPLGPAGDSGLSVAAPGCSARHIHAVLLLRPGTYDDVLKEKWGEWWNSNEIKAWCAKWPGLKASLEGGGWSLANTHVAMRNDPYIGGLWYSVDWLDLLFS
jgi:hypothetical protein